MPVSPHYMLVDSSETDPRIRKLFAYGHFSQHPDAQNVTAADLPNLTLDDHVVKEAVKSYQAYFVDSLSEITQQIHGRDAQPDGEVGEATSKLLEVPRCGVPEFANKEEANWPESCRNEITVSYRFNTINAVVAASAWTQALKAWVDRCELQFVLQSVFSQSTRVWATDGALPGSTLAWSMLAQNNCAARLEQRYDTLVNWDVLFLSKTIIHEVGHALGLNHISDRNAIMFPSISDIKVPGEPDIAAMVQLGYRRRTTPVPPPPEPGEMWTGSIASGGRSISLIGVSQ